MDSGISLKRNKLPERERFDSLLRHQSTL